MIIMAGSIIIIAQRLPVSSLPCLPRECTPTVMRASVTKHKHPASSPVCTMDYQSRGELGARTPTQLAAFLLTGNIHVRIFRYLEVSKQPKGAVCNINPRKPTAIVQQPGSSHCTTLSEGQANLKSCFETTRVPVVFQCSLVK